MPRLTSYWILLTNLHISETPIPPEGDFFSYVIAPNENLKKGDIVYLWWNPYSWFYGWGTIAETPYIFMEGEGPQKRKRQSVSVRREKALNPQITVSIMQRDSRLRNMIPTGFNDLCAIPLRPGQAHALNDFIRERNLDAPQGSTSTNWLAQENAPQIIIQAILTFGEKTKEGQLVDGVRFAWEAIIKAFKNNPEEIYNFDPWKFEELIAGAYELAGYDEVILTPRSNDKGRDVIAIKNGIGSIKIVDQVKRYKVSHLVDAEEVRALIGVISTDLSVSKGVVTTTSDFAPTLLDDENIKRLIPHRLELRPRNVLLPWLDGLRRF